MPILDDSELAKVIYSPVCMYCKHLRLEPWRTCAAFADRIPDAIWTGENDHREPWPGDGGVRFEEVQT